MARFARATRQTPSIERLTASAPRRCARRSARSGHRACTNAPRSARAHGAGPPVPTSAHGTYQRVPKPQACRHAARNRRHSRTRRHAENTTHTHGANRAKCVQTCNVQTCSIAFNDAVLGPRAAQPWRRTKSRSKSAPAEVRRFEPMLVAFGLHTRKHLPLRRLRHPGLTGQCLPVPYSRRVRACPSTLTVCLSQPAAMRIQRTRFLPA